MGNRIIPVACIISIVLMLGFIIYQCLLNFQEDKRSEFTDLDLLRKMINDGTLQQRLIDIKNEPA